MSYQPRLKTKFEETIKTNLKEKFGYTSTMQIPRITKICLNQGVGIAVADKKLNSFFKEFTISFRYVSFNLGEYVVAIT